MAVGDGVPREAEAPQPATAGATTRGDRLAAALRDNLRRRKAQQRRAVTKAGGDDDAGTAVVGEGGGTTREPDAT